MAKIAAKREKARACWPLLVSIVVFAATMLATPAAEASRYLPSTLTAAQEPGQAALERVDVFEIDDESFALFTDEDFFLLAAVSDLEEPERAQVLADLRFRLFPSSAPLPRRLEPLADWRPASGDLLYGFECNLWENRGLGLESWWTSDLYAFVGWGPHMGTDPMGTENMSGPHPSEACYSLPAAEMARCLEIVRVSEESQAAFTKGAVKTVVGMAIQAEIAFICPACSTYLFGKSISERREQGKETGAGWGETTGVVVGDMSGLTPAVEAVTGNEVYGGSLDANERSEKAGEAFVGITVTCTGAYCAAKGLAGKFRGKSNVPSEPIDSGWRLPDEGGAEIGGRWYTEHALERMAPDIPQVRAMLEARTLARAKAQGIEPATPEFKAFWQENGPQPRGIPPSVIEAEIANPGSTGVKVVINENGGVVTVFTGEGVSAAKPLVE